MPETNLSVQNASHARSIDSQSQPKSRQVAARETRTTPCDTHVLIPYTLYLNTNDANNYLHRRSATILRPWAQIKKGSRARQRIQLT
jgi:hypothetical protein